MPLREAFSEVNNQKRTQISDYLSNIGRKGAKTRWSSMSKEERAKEMSRRRRFGMERRKKKTSEQEEGLKSYIKAG